jgi:hypothetical protein
MAILKTGGQPKIKTLFSSTWKYCDIYYALLTAKNSAVWKLLWKDKLSL